MARETISRSGAATDRGGLEWGLKLRVLCWGRSTPSSRAVVNSAIAASWDPNGEILETTRQMPGTNIDKIRRDPLGELEALQCAPVHGLETQRPPPAESAALDPPEVVPVLGLDVSPFALVELVSPKLQGLESGVVVWGGGVSLSLLFAAAVTACEREGKVLTVLDGVTAGEKMIMHGSHGGQMVPARDAGFEDSIGWAAGIIGNAGGGPKCHDEY
ncbi:hypothetical protein PG994_013863 [Apiospora phragmitis]|uniref:Uncharacterized protein n=1 Tax=Apiospora phragmitis TaxID=2905665 RepID=A0ABR1T2P8_9PEZI